MLFPSPAAVSLHFSSASQLPFNQPDSFSAHEDIYLGKMFYFLHKA